MKIIKPSVKLIWITPEAIKRIEEAGRTCYKSESLITNDSAEKFVKMIIKRGHESVLEHGVASMRFICDRGVTHELVRHRIASYSQESTRYCNYGDKEIEFIEPCFWKNDKAKLEIWKTSMQYSEKVYKTLIELLSTPQEARSVLPNSLKTEIVVTMNFREWRYFLKLRCSKAAHPQMREIANMALEILKKEIPVIVEDII